MYKIGDKNRATLVSYELVWKSERYKKAGSGAFLTMFQSRLTQAFAIYAT